MDAYFDSAIIVKLYVQEATSLDAIRLVGGYAAPYALTQWQALEVKNAVRLKAFRREITWAEMNQSITAFEQDIATGRWQRPAYTALAVEKKAEELSADHAATFGCRTLDIPALICWGQRWSDSRWFGMTGIEQLWCVLTWT